MDYYRRFSQDGACEVICTRCFLTVGQATELDAVRELEAHHVCLEEAEESASRHETHWADRLKMAMILSLVVFLLYVGPTTIEFSASRTMNPWLSVILFGDFTGCAWLFAFFRFRKAAVLLYISLTALEALLYACHIVPASALSWIVDVVPTLAVVAVILKTQTGKHGRLFPAH